MIQEGFTTREIVSEVGCSASTISRTRKEFKNNIQQGRESTVEQALLKSLYQIFLGLELMYVMPEEEKLYTYFRDCAADLTENVLEADYELVKKVLFESGFFDYIMELLKSKPEKLNRDDQRYRQKWIKILKKWHPEKLAELV